MLRFTCSFSSKVVSGALRAIASSTILSGPTVDAFAASHHQFHLHAIKAPNFVSHYFSTDANISIDRNLVKALKSEIKSHKLSLPPPKLPDDFPFTIHEDLEQEDDDDDDDSCKLTRELNGERIHVSIAMPNKIQEELRIAAADEPAPDPGVCLPEQIRLDVRIVKGNGESVSFDVVICPHVLYVTTMSVSEPHSDGRFICYGEHEVEEEGELQSGLREYLKMRGIKTCYAEFMYKYMVWKSKQAALNTLKGLKKFIKDS